MNEVIQKYLHFLELKRLQKHWDTELNEAKKKNPSYQRFLFEILEKEYLEKKEKKRLARIKRAKIPEVWIMDTFPFKKQHNLKKKLVLNLYDSMDFISQKQTLTFIGPTGCGKSGLATSFLIHAINHEQRGFFIDFKELIDQLHTAMGDHSENKIIARFQAYDVLLIDELGYHEVGREGASLFFNLMKKRHHKKTTFITTQLGFEEWGCFLKNKHITAALLDRITENCTIFNMKKCISIRPKNITYATSE